MRLYEGLIPMRISRMSGTEATPVRFMSQLIRNFLNRHAASPIRPSSRMLAPVISTLDFQFQNGPKKGEPDGLFCFHSLIFLLTCFDIRQHFNQS